MIEAYDVTEAVMHKLSVADGRKTGQRKHSTQINHDILFYKGEDKAGANKRGRVRMNGIPSSF